MMATAGRHALSLVAVAACLSCTVTALSSSSAVRIQVEKALEGVTPKQAKEAWLSYQWERGGGLPVFVKHDDAEQTRRLFPIGMEERLVEESDDEDDTIRYQVTDMGPLMSSDLSAHSAEVRFVQDEDADATDMIWNVEFEAKQRASFWKTVTELMIETVSANLASNMAVPRLYRRTTRLPLTDDNLAQKWIDFVWNQGGGLPIPPPLKLGDEKRMIVPPFLVERLIDVSDNGIQYTVDNPGLFTYQVHTHAGRVRFEPISSEEVEMVWEVEIRPYLGWSWLVERFTSALLTTLARNFKVHVSEPGATVMVAPPRGKGEAFGQVPKDTWLGGVLAAHLSDKRSTAEQTLAIFQPWTWGRSTDDVGEGQEWSTGAMSSV